LTTEPGEDAVPPPPWQRTPVRPVRRRRDPISREAIVAAAMQLLDADGLSALSMRRIAGQLGTGAASLYWHVGSKDGLLDLIFDELVGEVTVPDPDPRRWREQVKDIARAQRAVSLRHPYAVQLSIGRIPMGPNALRYSERTLAVLRAGGLPPRLAVQGSHLLIATVNGFTLDETGVEGPAAEEATAAPAAATADLASSYLAALPPERFPNLVALAGEFSYADPNERFELLIDIFVDGLARLAEPG
jgi:AcrR family transcriptional regulator